MQRPAELAWSEPSCLGDLPTKRSGHTFTLCGQFAYLFGGSDQSHPPGPTAALYKLDVSSLESLYWSKVELPKGARGPKARFKHTGVLDGDRIVYFGGFHSTAQRLNDVWLLNTESSKWEQPPGGKTTESPEGEVVFKRDWLGVPDPRGAHSAAVYGREMYIFGGYGGKGYARSDFNDLHALDLDAWEWREVDTEGEKPLPRSGHQCVVALDKLYLFGGWNASFQFNDVHVLDLKQNVWSVPETGSGESWGPPRWNHSACAVFAVPHWKVFVFGGNTGDLSDGTNPQGLYSNELVALETGAMEWDRPQMVGKIPAPRADSEIVYDADGGKMFLFGGWASRWFGQLYVCEVAEVVGPPYSVEKLTPTIGCITGSTPLKIFGIGFASVKGDTIVRFACPQGYEEVSGRVVDDTTIECEAPKFEKYGPVEVELRVKIGKKTFTNSKLSFSFFAVTDSRQTMAFGPGVLPGFALNEPVFFVIQAKDKHGLDRVCGMDEFCVEVGPKDFARLPKDALGEEELGGEEVDEEALKKIAEKREAAIAAYAGLHVDIVDEGDGTYVVTYTATEAGDYDVYVDFLGTFEGVGGPIAGSPFRVTAAEDADAAFNILEGGLLMKFITESTTSTKKYCSKTLAGLQEKVPEDEREPLIAVKEHLQSVEEQRENLSLVLNCNRSALSYLQRQGNNVDRLLDKLNGAAASWEDVQNQAPVTANTIVHTTKQWSVKTEEEILSYEATVKKLVKDFAKLEFWTSELGVEEARVAMDKARKSLETENKTLEAKKHLCVVFEFPDKIAASQKMYDKMVKDLGNAEHMWTASEKLDAFIEGAKQALWAQMKPEDIEEAAKSHLKALKALNKDVKWSDAFAAVDKRCKDFLVTVPLVQLLGAPSMRPRHWEKLMNTTGREFVPPYENPSIVLGDILALKLHEFTADVEEICDQAVKEGKMETTLVELDERWASIEWLANFYKDTDVPLLKVGEEDFESLEADQLCVQGMLASRYLAQFETEVTTWQRNLAMVNDIYGLLGEIQRTWSYLEPLFIHSEEVKRELPEDAERFKVIDVDVKDVLKTAWEVKNIKDACNADGLLEKLEEIQGMLDLCKKSLADFLDGRRRQFPRYYFVSEADLLDILSNGGTPAKVLVHTAKVYLSTKTLVLSEEVDADGRPAAVKWVAGVGVEETDFEPRVPLKGKVEIYMQTVLDAMKTTLFKNLERSLVRYHEMSRPEWLMHKDPKSGRPSDPAQIILLTLAVNYVAEVEAAFHDLASDANAMKAFNKKQIDQLNDLIRLTQSDLSKGDRKRVMACITMDAHGRDVVQNLIRQEVGQVDAFQWQSQLKHKYREPPPHANFRDRDPELRGEGNERAEIAICDAILPYDYEYLGNGPRLVITPLTDRIYVTATQALNLKMGCAPAGPAGTGKTETTKDLASALAKCCYVFNCSPEMDYRSMGSIFMGLASSGSWGCFDEFNRLIPEVLSVCTVQFKAVCDGCKAGAKKIVIEGTEVRLDPTCGAYITMNPGYLGRSELPEGLKALFRPMTVMVPDLVLICENMLMAEGFVEAKVLASKFYGLYSLLKQLLSKQLHYDWGLRAVKSVLVVAGAFKRAEPDLPEQDLLMRALRDFNIPKIVREDNPVFFGLLGDLFPGIDPPRSIDDELETYVTKACHSVGNWPDADFRLKVVQLEELLAIRHCVFVMGPPGAGKSQAWRTLREARRLSDNKTKYVDINPKSVSTNELYGYISLATREWKDGLLSKVMRDLVNIPDETPKWILLDGDLDANWIESMNSVMDDNRMLTLASNERIPLAPHMRMIFEIRDLVYATPATVSRAGILYISTADGTQWRSLISSWLQRRTEPQEAKDTLRSCFDTYIADTLLWLKINTKSVVNLEDMNLVTSLLYMLDCSLTAENTSDATKLETIFVYCAIWAFGSALGVSDDGSDYRKLFSDYWRSEWKSVKFPSRETVFDYWLDPETSTFDQWTKSPYIVPIDFDSRKMNMSSITVQTPETCSATYWMQNLVEMRRPVMLAGLAGTGKTQMVKGMLASSDPSVQQSYSINFNFYTTSAVLQNTMMLPLEKKTGTNFGPPGQARLVYFVDDLNLPEVDKYNTQSAIALLRQYMEYEHFYDLTKLTSQDHFHGQVVSCMNPTAGSFEVNPRLQRWFVTFAIGLPGPTSLLTIYQTFLDGHLRHFSENVQEVSNNLIKAALGLHKQVEATFRKTASNFHYEFNIRHLSNVFQGLLISEPEQFTEADKFVVLWLHESERVYADRLVSLEDVTKYNMIAQAQCKKNFPTVAISQYYAGENADLLVFCHFAESALEQIYDKVPNLPHMQKVLTDTLASYNETNATMDLVLFEDAMKHVARISRIILSEGGHALLVGVGGSGKQSLTRLASFICDYSVYQIVISGNYGMTDFKDDLKNMYNKAGLKEEGVTFMITDSQITNERFLVLLNDLLSSGFIPDLFAQDEVDGIVNAVTSKVKAAGLVPEKKNCWDFFISEIRKNLHVVLAFSPVGEDFRNRARKFPALVSCTVIDWFQPWPREALHSVGKFALKELDLGSDATRGAIEGFLPQSFEDVNKAAIEFRRVERREVHTTPKSYLELLSLYSILLEMKREEADNAIERLANGLQKLKETSEAVAEIEEDLKVKLEAADKKKAVAEEIAETVSKEKAIVEVETAKANVEAEQVAKIQADVAEQQRSCAEDLAKAEPAVKSAMAALDTLDKKELGECKTMLKPPVGVDEVFAATMVLLAKIYPNISCDKRGRVKDREWGAAKKQCLGNIPEYMDALKNIKAAVDDGSIPTINMQEVRPYLEKDFFTPEVIGTKNSAAAGLCSFVINIVQYYDIVVTVEPKRLALAEANATLEEANNRLKVVQENVAELEAKLAKLTTELEAATKDKQEAIDSVNRGERKLNLANRLTTALASENVRWAENIQVLRSDKELLMGDVLLASAFISYIGPFTKPFRTKLMDSNFVPFLQNAFSAAAGEGGTVPMSASSDVIRILCSSADIASWNTDGLPADIVSTENAAIVVNSARWPLIIDPQLQGIRWIRNMESKPERNFQIVRLSQSDYLRKLERSLENGHSFFIENLGESLDAVIMPLIQRAAIKRGHKQYIKLGDTEIEFHTKFKLYLHTKLSNPHYPPEIQAECTLINFTVTAAGLEDQLLALTVTKERPDLAKMSEELVAQQNGFKIKMKELEDGILYKLATAEGDITEDVDLIEGLEDTKRISNDIQEKSAQALLTQERIKITSEKYRPVANRSSLLFFLMNDLGKMHSYYIYSLAAFTIVFFRGIDNCDDSKPQILVAAEDDEQPDGEEEAAKRIREPTDEELVVRCKTLIESITMTVFNYVRRGLFEVDKLTVATLLTLKIGVNDGFLSQQEVDFLIMGKSSSDPGNMGPLGEWMPEAVWPKVKALEALKDFNGLGDNMQSDSDDWQQWFDSEASETAKLPGDYQKSLEPFARLILLRCLRPDRVTTALRTYIADVMGSDYIFQPPFDMDAAYSETSNQTPVFFVLFPGVDPTPLVENLGATMGISLDNGNFVNISMGQGQEKLAENVVEKFAKSGGWVMLQNTHLMQSWVPKLERLLEVVQEGAHTDFRCFISAEPPPMASMKNMPESLLQSCIKVANEAPADIKSNLTRAWAQFSEERVEACTKPTDFKACLFSLCWFHSIVLGRRRFGQQGWSRKYSFNNGDLVICSNVLTAYLDANPTVPWQDLRYIFGEIMYGGHITDAWDRRTNSTYLEVLFNPGLLSGMDLAPGFKSPNPSELNFDDYYGYIKQALPPESPPQFGLHPNAEIGYLTNSADSLFKTILAIAGAGGGGDGGGHGEDVVKTTMEDLLERLPENFEMITLDIKAQALMSGETSPFVTVAVQECKRMNALMSEIRRSLVELDKGLKGQLNMSQAMEDLVIAFTLNQWPGRNPFSLCRWEKMAWPSLKSLDVQFIDMLQRVKQLSAWTEELETPLSLWLPGLFNPTAFLTAVMQVTARRTGAPLDKMTTETHVSTIMDSSAVDFYPEDGAFVHGLFLEGARWPVGDDIDDDPYIVGNVQVNGYLSDGRLKELTPSLPVIYVRAVPVQPMWEPSAVGYLRHDDNIYECPVYITAFRGPTYVFLATLKTLDRKSKWVLTGTAILMQD